MATGTLTVNGTPTTTAFDGEVLPLEERRTAGKALRTATPRTSHADWDPSKRTSSIVDVVKRTNKGRITELLPVRHSRMAASPFAFYRGSALQMALDLATTPCAGPRVQLCGDAHIANFGVFASPERRLVFDLNDFDETWPGPFEWDVKRMAASIAIAGRERGLAPDEARRVVHDAVSAYRDWMDEFAEMPTLDLFYLRIDTDAILQVLSPELRRRTEEQLKKVSAKNNLKALDKLTQVVDGRRRIIPDPPLVTPLAGPALEKRLKNVLDLYVQSLSAERRQLFDQFRFVDFARKVVGVGSVGTRCFIVLLQGPNGGPLFLQLKEAVHPSVAVALGDAPQPHQGERVVDGQRRLQAVSDVMLGWSTDKVGRHDYFVRQLWDAKGSVDINLMRPAGFRAYTRLCAVTLARAHARTGVPAIISGYVGTSDTFPDAICDFADAYADQTVLDHAAFVAAIESGKLPSA